MSIVNLQTKEISVKIVYYGTGLGGKTTNLKYIHSQVSPVSRGELISLATETERTLFFDFMPLDLGRVQGFSVRLSPISPSAGPGRIQCQPQTDS